MIRAYILPCKLPKSEADALNQESGRIYSEVLTWHWRFYRHTGHWLSMYDAGRFNDLLGDTALHAHSRDAAQQGFYKAVKVTHALRKAGIDAKFPYKRHNFRTTVWKNTGIRIRNGYALLARARSLDPVRVSLPAFLLDFPEKAFVEARLVYDKAKGRYSWHFVLDDGLLPNTAPGNKTLAIDLGEIHPMAVANEQGQVLIVTARELRSLNQYRDKRMAEIDSRISRCQKGSRMWKRLKRRKRFMLARNENQCRDIEHKVTRAVTNHAVKEQACRVVVGDIRDIANGKRLNKNSQQKISNWSHGKQVAYLKYKLAAEGIRLERQDEAYSSKTCPACGSLNKPRGRNYKCSACGFVGHRDGSAACNQESKALYGQYGKIQPTQTMYLRPFDRRRSSSV